jgi:hypothetical protein
MRMIHYKQLNANPHQAHYMLHGRREAAWTREREPVAEGEELYVIWKTKGGRIPCDEYQSGLGYAGHLPTDKASAEWYAKQATERIKGLYHWQQNVEFEVVAYQPKNEQEYS